MAAMVVILAAAGLAGCATDQPQNFAKSSVTPDGAAVAPAPAGNATVSVRPRTSDPSPAPPPGGGQLATLAPYRINDTPVQSFGFAVAISRSPTTRQVISITVLEVWPDGPAERAGLRPRASILKINGRPVQAFSGSLSRGSELNRLLMNRRNGERLNLEVTQNGGAPEEISVVEGGVRFPFVPDTY